MPIKCFHDNIEVSFLAVADRIQVYTKMSDLCRILQQVLVRLMSIPRIAKRRRQMFTDLVPGLDKMQIVDEENDLPSQLILFN